LQPRFFKYKKLHKNRKFYYFKKIKNLSFGDAGLCLLKPTQLTSGHISKFKLFLKRAVRKPDKTKRLCWFNVFPHLPLTRKAVGSRMGKGKGKVQKWFTTIHAGTILFEITNLRFGRTCHFFKQMTFKLGKPTKFIFDNTFCFQSPFSQKNKIFFRIFW
jgi:large subunit ribosomal protein L16